MNILKLRFFMKFFLALSASALSLNAVAENGGSVPLKYTGNPAKDLKHPKYNRLMSKREVIRYQKRGGDISLLNPKKTDIWSDKTVTLSKELDDLKIDSTHTFKYVDRIGTSDGTDAFRFIIRENYKNKLNRRFSVWVSKDSRSLLLRKNFLRKLGYKVRKSMHQQELKLKFNGVKSMEIFLDDLNDTTFTTDRWKVSSDEKKKEIVLRDVLIIETNSPIYTLETGNLDVASEDPIKHRRVMNSLLIPFSIVDLRETVDGLSWFCGKVNNGQLLLSLYGGNAFTTTYNDAKWILRRIGKLKRSDFEEIVKYAYFPASVEKLMVEKVIARFNSFYQHFGLKKLNLSYNPEVSDSSGELVRGRLTKDSWDGHASRYSFDDTESPLASDEMRAFFKAKGLSALIENLVGYLNQNYLYNTNIQEEAIERQIQAQKDQIADFISSGFTEFKRIPFSTWALPTFKGNILASRDIVTGSYLGTDNRIQVADTLEYLGEAGVFVGTLGLPVGATAFAGANARFTRSYTHVKSIKSIKKALKEPFKNILVPLLKRKKGLGFNGIIRDLESLKKEADEIAADTELDEDERAEKEEKRKEKKSETLGKLKDILGVGESLIVSNNLALSTSVNGGISWEKIDGIFSLSARKINLWRLHIVRVSEQVIQIYKSRAATLGTGFGFKLNVLMPIVSLNFDKNSGTVTTKFNSVSVNGALPEKDLIRNMKELRAIVLSNSLTQLEERKKPFVIKHDFSEKSRTSTFLHEKETRVDLLDTLKLINPQGHEANLVIRSTGKQKGVDYQKVAIDSINALISELIDTDTDYSVSNASSGNPGDSFKGHSFTRTTTLEVPNDSDDSLIPFEEYASITSKWKGWKASKGKINKIRTKIQEKYGTRLFSDDLFADTKEIQLYGVDVTLSLYQRGINHLIGMNANTMEELLHTEGVLPWPKGVSHFRRRFSNRGAGQRYNAYKRHKEALISVFVKSHQVLKSDYAHLLNNQTRSKHLLNIVNISELILPFDIFIDVVGGEDHLFVQGVVNGFRVGPEDGEEAIVSHSIGRYGSEFTDGAFAKLREVLGISQGELGAYWLLRRLQ